MNKENEVVKHEGEVQDNSKDVAMEATEEHIETVHVTPLSDILEREKEVVIFSNMAGVEKEALDISIEDRILTIHGEYISPAGDEPDERVVKRCYDRQFKLGEDINTEGIKASLEQGVLSLTLPKAVKEEPKKISVAVN